MMLIAEASVVDSPHKTSQAGVCSTVQEDGRDEWIARYTVGRVHVHTIVHILGAKIGG